MTRADNGTKDWAKIHPIEKRKHRTAAVYEGGIGNVKVLVVSAAMTVIAPCVRVLATSKRRFAAFLGDRIGVKRPRGKTKPWHWLANMVHIR